MAGRSFNFEVPINDSLTQGSGLISRPWEGFFRFVQKALLPLGIERAFALANNQSTFTPIEGLAFTALSVSQATVDFLIQRVTIGAGAVELIESGSFIAVYKPGSDSWSLFYPGTTGPSDSGVDFSITSAGQVQYTSSNITGTPSISKITFRARTLGAKNSQYSAAGR
jgi:hypothetical protein